MHLLLFFPTRITARGPIPKVTPPLIAALRARGVRVRVAHWGRRTDRESRREKLAGRARDLLVGLGRAVRERPDVSVLVTAHDRVGVLRDLPLALGLRVLRRPCVLFFHGSRPDQLGQPGQRWFTAATRLLLRLTDGALVLSTEEQRAWQVFAPGYPLAVVRNPSALATVAPAQGAEPPAAWRVADGVPVLLFAGRLIEEKGILVLIEALALVRQERPVHLLVAGDGPARPKGERRAAALGVSDAVTFAGYLTGARLDAAYRAAAALALPTWWPEGLPSVITEALPYGLPIITTPVRGAIDYLVEGRHALFVPPGDAAALARSIRRLLNDHELQARMRAANREKALDFTADAAARVFIAALQGLTRGAGRKHAPETSIAPPASRGG